MFCFLLFKLLLISCRSGANGKTVLERITNREPNNDPASAGIGLLLLIQELG